MKNWIAVFTKPACEEKARAHLRRQGFEVYLPTFRRRRSHARRIDIVTRPLFPRYMFVCLDLLLARWRPIMGTLGVSCVLCDGDAPRVVPDRVVDALREGEGAGAFDETDPASRLKPGDAVRIVAGPFADLIGKFQALTDAERVVVLLDLLGREVVVRVPNGAVAAD